jgi:hypothetical protein
MKSENVLKLHKLFMDKYDKLVPRIIEGKGNVEEFINVNLPAVVFSETFAYTEPKDYAKIAIASTAAFKIASLRENPDDFREAYDASLRVELYRQFLAMNQDLEALKIKFIKENKTKATVGQITEFLFNDVTNNMRAEFGKFEKIKSSLSATDCELIRSMEIRLNRLMLDLTLKIRTINNNGTTLTQMDTIKAIQDATLDFEIAAGQLIRGYQVKAESDSSLAPFLKNMLLLISLIGTIPAIVSIGNKVINGSYSFFDNQALHKPTSPEEMTIEDQLLAKPITI